MGNLGQCAKNLVFLQITISNKNNRQADAIVLEHPVACQKE